MEKESNFDAVSQRSNQWNWKLKDRRALFHIKHSFHPHLYILPLTASFSLAQQNAERQRERGVFESTYSVPPRSHVRRNWRDWQFANPGWYVWRVVVLCRSGESGLQARSSLPADANDRPAVYTDPCVACSNSVDITSLTSIPSWHGRHWDTGRVMELTGNLVLMVFFKNF